MEIDLLKFLKKVLLAIVIVLLFLALFSFITTQIYLTNFYLKIDYEGLINWVSYFLPFKFIFTATFITLSAYIGIETLSSKKIVDEGKALLDLRNIFDQEELREVNKNLRPIVGKWTNENISGINELRENWHKIDAYIETFEFANILIDKGVISLSTFKNHFEYWLENLVDSDWIRNKIKTEDRNWDNFINLCEKLEIKLKPVNMDDLLKKSK